MNPVVIYSTRTGNTEKVATEIAKELNCKLIKISGETDFSTISLTDFDVVFIGTWIRGGEPSPDMYKFLRQLSLEDDNREFALFMTWVGGGKSDVMCFNRVKPILDTKNQRLRKDYFKCFGEGFRFVKRGHPSEKDLADARKWARNVSQEKAKT